MMAMEPLDVRSLVLYDEDAVLLLGLAMEILSQVGGKEWHGNVGQDFSSLYIRSFIPSFIHLFRRLPVQGINAGFWTQDVPVVAVAGWMDRLGDR